MYVFCLILLYISISLAFFATTERPETTLRHPGPRLEDCSNCRKVYVDINPHAIKHIDDQNECFQVPVRMCQRMEPRWLWMSFQQRCPWGMLGPQSPVQACFYNASNPTSDFDGYQGFRVVPELLMTKDLQGLEVKQLDCDILLSLKPFSLMGFWRSWHNLCGWAPYISTLRWFWWWNFGGWILNWNSPAPLPCPMAARSLCWQVELSQWPGKKP